MASSSNDIPPLVLSSHERQFAGPPWVRELKKRMPRHQEDPEEDWFLAKEIPSGERWFQGAVR